MDDQRREIHPVHRHEHSDVSVRMIVWFLLGLAGMGLMIHFALAGLTWWFGEVVIPPDAHSAFSEPRHIPPQPRLQVAPRADLLTYLESERQRMTSFGIDSKTGAVHIPVDLAIDLVAKQGLPARTSPARQSAPSGSKLPPSGFVPLERSGTSQSGTGRSPGVNAGSQRIVPSQQEGQEGGRKRADSAPPQ
jgi:hypothetical protein